MTRAAKASAAIRRLRKRSSRIRRSPTANAKTHRLEFHPVAEIFPLIEGQEYQQLVDDVRTHGLREPITLHPDGRIFDGRNRYRACVEAGVDPRTEKWAGDGDPLPFIISRNVHRRHLTESQRALVAARIADMRQGARTDLAPIGATSQQHAADMMRVSRRQVQRAKKVIKRGTSKLIAAIEQGDITIAAAEPMTQLAPAEQDAVIDSGISPPVTHSPATTPVTVPPSQETREIRLAGTIDDMLDVTDAVAESLGLIGVFTVRGLDGEGAAEYRSTVHEFEIDATPAMTPLHIMRRAATEYVRLHGEHRWHRFFESINIDSAARTITLNMGS